MAEIKNFAAIQINGGQVLMKLPSLKVVAIQFFCYDRSSIFDGKVSSGPSFP
jgi:hypothetical protein